MPYYYPAPDFAAEDIAATGTVTAEQVTSTDDATVADQLLMTEAAGNHVATPTIALGDGDSGIYESADDTVNFVSEGVAVFQINTGDQVVLLEAAGNHVAAPTLAFGDGDTGVYESADDTLNLVSEGVAVARINTGDQFIVLETPGAHTAAPSLAFGDADSGFYEAADDYMVAVSAGVAHFQWTGSEVRSLVKFTLGGRMAFEGVISPTAILANTNDYAPTGIATANVLRLDSDGAYDLTGLTGETTGKAMLLINISAFTITLKHDVTSTAAYRFLLPGNADYALLANEAVWLFYDATSARWRTIGAT